MLEAFVLIVLCVETGAPALVAEGWIGDDVVEGLERVAFGVQRAGERVALLDFRRGIVVQNHVHAGEAGGGIVLFLPVESDLYILAVARFVADFQEQRARAARRVIDGGVIRRGGVADSENLRDDAANFRRRVELALALATLSGEVPHEILVGVAQEVVAIGAVLREIEGRILEDGDEVGQLIDHLLAATELVYVVEIGEV